MQFTPGQNETTRNAIHAGRISLFFKQLHRGLIINLVIGVILVLGLWGQFPPHHLLLWQAGLTTSLGMRYYTYLYFVRHGLSAFPPRRWEHFIIAGAMSSGVMWGLAALLLYPAGNLPMEMFVLFILGSIAVGALPYLSLVPMAYALYATPISLSVIITLAIRGQDSYYAIAGTVAIFGLILVGSAKSIYTTITTSLTLRHENETLVKELTREVRHRVEAEQQLRISEERFRRLTQATAESVIIHRDGIIIDANDSLARIAGQPVVNLIDKPLLHLFSESEHARIEQHLDSPLDSKFETLGLRVDGSQYPAELCIRNISFNEQPVHVLIMHDITERKAMEQQMLRAQKLQAVGTLAGGVAHDFNNLLTAIMGYTDLCVQDVPESSQLHTNLQQINTASLRAKDLVKQILAFSNNSKLDLQQTVIHDAVEEAIRLLRATLPTNITLEGKYLTNEDCVVIDPSKLNQVIMNLCINAYHAMDNRNGRILIEVSRQQISQKTGLSDGAYACIKVSDNGNGMDELVLQRIFEPFYTTKEVGKGTGLGLSVVHGIVTGAGGDIQVQSTPGVGTTFTLLLPAVSAST